MNLKDELTFNTVVLQNLLKLSWLSQKEFCEQIDITESYLSNILNNKKSPSTEFILKMTTFFKSKIQDDEILKQISPSIFWH